MPPLVPLMPFPALTDLATHSAPYRDAQLQSTRTSSSSSMSSLPTALARPGEVQRSPWTIRGGEYQCWGAVDLGGLHPLLRGAVHGRCSTAPLGRECTSTSLPEDEVDADRIATAQFKEAITEKVHGQLERHFPGEVSAVEQVPV